MLVENSNINSLPFLGTMRGKQKLDERGYKRKYKSFGGSDNVRKGFAKMGNSQGAEGYKTKGEDYYRHHDHIFLTVRILKETKQIEMNSFGYALTQSMPIPEEEEAAHQWDLLVNCVDASNIQSIVSNLFEPVMDAPQDGDLALYSTSKATTTPGGIRISAHKVTQAGVYRNSQQPGGGIESKWDFVKNPYIFQHDVFAVPNYFGTKVTFLRPKPKLDTQILSNLVELPHELKTEGCRSSKPLKGTAALVLQASYDHNGQFNPSKGFYKRGMLQLQKAGCSTFVQKIETPEDFQSSISKATDASISFLWLRFHGSQKSMKASSTYSLHADEITEVFKELPSKLTNKAVIYLDSCSTGSLKDNFFDNVQFAFAKLTAQMPDVATVAPSEDSYINLIEWDEANGFLFETTQSPLLMNKNITVTLGRETKDLLRKSQEGNGELSQIKETLFQSLQKDQSIKKLSGQHHWIKESKDNVDAGLIKSINSNDKDVFEDVRYFIEELGADVNAPKHLISPPFINLFGPLFAAIHKGNGDLVAYLLKCKADPNQSTQGISPKTYAEQLNQHEIARLL